MPPTSSPPSFYQNVAAMSPAAPKAGGGAPGGAKGGKNPDAELLAGYNGMYKLMSKMQEAKPELQQGFEAVQEILKKQLVDIFKQNPDEVMKPEGGASATPPGGASPQGDQPAPTPTPDADRVPA